MDEIFRCKRKDYNVRERENNNNIYSFWISYCHYSVVLFYSRQE